MKGVRYTYISNSHCLEAARRREDIKECLTTVKQAFFCYPEGSLVDHQAYKPSTLHRQTLTLLSMFWSCSPILVRFIRSSVERQNVHVESGFLLALQGLWEHCVQGNVVLMSIILLNQYFIQIFLNRTCL